MFLFSVNFVIGKDVLLFALELSKIITFKKLLCSVDVLIVNNKLILAQGFPTFITLKRFLSSMKMLMLCETEFVTEHFPILSKVKSFPHNHLSADWGMSLEWKPAHIHKISLRMSF